jgi:FkbM family methyltransferase
VATISNRSMVRCDTFVVYVMVFSTVQHFRCLGQQIHTILRKLKRNYPEYEPDVVLDIGANRGLYAKVVRELFPTSKIIMFEASSFHNAALAEFVTNDIGKSEHYIAVLSSKSNDKVLFYDKMGNTGNSMFKERTKAFDGVSPSQKVTATVDTLLADSLLMKDSKVDIIKVDVQGAELVVFEGATEALRQATFVQFEASTIEFNSGGACFHEIDSLLRSHGFYLYDTADQTYNDVFKTKGMGQYDAMYIKPTSSRLPQWLTDQNPVYCGQGRINNDISTTAQGSKSPRFDSSGHAWLGGFDGYFGFMSGVFVTVCIQLLRAARPKLLNHRN